MPRRLHGFVSRTAEWSAFWLSVVSDTALASLSALRTAEPCFAADVRLPLRGTTRGAVTPGAQRRPTARRSSRSEPFVRRLHHVPAPSRPVARPSRAKPAPPALFERLHQAKPRPSERLRPVPPPSARGGRCEGGRHDRLSPDQSASRCRYGGNFTKKEQRQFRGPVPESSPSPGRSRRSRLRRGRCGCG
jgi:hypothetical protein